MNQAKRSKLVIFMEGGLIQWMYSDAPIDIAKIDYDVDLTNEEDIGFIIDESGDRNSAFITLTDAVMDEDMCHNFYNQVSMQIEEAEKNRLLEIERKDEYGR